MPASRKRTQNINFIIQILGHKYTKVNKISMFHPSGIYLIYIFGAL
jgi:hypothetical protein